MILKYCQDFVGCQYCGSGCKAETQGRVRTKVGKGVKEKQIPLVLDL